jgi:MoxR-like ATPase
MTKPHHKQYRRNTVKVVLEEQTIVDKKRSLGPAGDEDAASVRLEATLFEIKRVIVGQEELLERVFVAMLTGGHLLIEGVPGLAKTLTVRTVADVVGGSFSRVQFTPADLVGTRIFRPDSAKFESELGPVFCNFLLADEINRAPAKVQSALLEVMQERQVTIGKESYRVPQPFLVMATQNPIESEGTYSLPEAQLDRFLMKVIVGYPDFAEETSIVHRSLQAAEELERVLSPDELDAFQRTASSIYVDRSLVEYAVRLTSATRRPDDYGLSELAPYVDFGASPRGAVGLVHAAQAMVFIRGRNYVLPQDVKAIAKDVLRHRLILTYEALAEEISADEVLDEVFEAVRAPEIDLGWEESA